MKHVVLLIDSNESFAQELHRVLEQKDLELITATSAMQGIDLAWSELPSVILLSVELSDVNGFIVCSLLKKNSRLKNIPVLLMSSSVNESTFKSHATLKSHAEGYFHKTSNVGNLTSSVFGFLSIPREEMIVKISNIAAEKPVLRKPISSIVLWCILGFLFLSSIVMFTWLK